MPKCQQEHESKKVQKLKMQQIVTEKQIEDAKW